MANGIEDLIEKNKDRAPLKPDARYEKWLTFQGREDAEMLQEKSSGWSSKKSSSGDYDSWDDE